MDVNEAYRVDHKKTDHYANNKGFYSQTRRKCKPQHNGTRFA